MKNTQNQHNLNIGTYHTSMFFTQGLKEWHSGGKGPEDTSEGKGTRPEDKPEVAASPPELGKWG